MRLRLWVQCPGRVEHWAAIATSSVLARPAGWGGGAACAGPATPTFAPAPLHSSPAPCRTASRCWAACSPGQPGPPAVITSISSGQSALGGGNHPAPVRPHLSLHSQLPAPALGRHTILIGKHYVRRMIKLYTFFSVKGPFSYQLFEGNFGI